MKGSVRPDVGSVASPGDMLLFYKARGLSTLISFVTRSPFYHVAIAVDATVLIEAVPKGVVRTSIDSKPNHKFVIIPAPNKTIGRAALGWAESQVGDGYDPADLLAIALDRIFKHLHVNLVHGDRYTCGEFVATAFAKAGCHLFPDLKLEDVVPADFARLLPAEDRQAKGVC